MEPGMEIISSDGRRVGYVGPAQVGISEFAISENTIPSGWIARIDREVILRKTFKSVMVGLGNAPWKSRSNGSPGSTKPCTLPRHVSR
jgi:hypothetical protein